ncbi:unnamed protein product [Phytophthora fragariaefolia]|uniref:Unnamed protein product n=1 Tax=Phytophthora fragariaefolia TaxID=1490495 RepID=A0A9W6XFR8_9STRA|nr:unnamed protein product [Phytophthora fragariaefolia]
MLTRRWCTVALLVLHCSGATGQAEAALSKTTTMVQASDAGRVQAPANEISATVKPGRNGYGTVTYGSTSVDRGDDSEATANRLALAEAEKKHPNLRLRLGIGI